jgi:hypothetical protein
MTDLAPRQSDDTPAAYGSDTLPEGHPIPWVQLVPYEQQQGGYWLYPHGCDVYGNGRLWVGVPRPHGEEGQ